MTASQPHKSINSFQAKGRSLETQFRKAIESQERIYLPPRRYTLSEPVEFEHALLLQGHFGKFYSADLFEPTTILADAALKGRPLFHRKGYYVDHNDVWRASDGTAAHLVSAAAMGCGLTVQVEGIAFQSLHEDGCIMQVYNASLPTYVKNCSFGQSFRGLMLLNTFGAVVESCAFQGSFRYPWLSNLDRVKRGWGLLVGNNVTITQCNWQGGLVGLQMSGTGNQLSGGRIERNIYGLVLGGKNLNPDVSPQYYGQISASSFSTVMGVTFESNLFGILMRAHAGTTMMSTCVTGTNAPQLDGATDGPCEYGINVEYLNPASAITNCAVSGDFRQGAVLGGEFRPGPSNIINNSHQST